MPFSCGGTWIWVSLVCPILVNTRTCSYILVHTRVPAFSEGGIFHVVPPGENLYVWPTGAGPLSLRSPDRLERRAVRGSPWHFRNSQCLQNMQDSKSGEQSLFRRGGAGGRPSVAIRASMTSPNYHRRAAATNAQWRNGRRAITAICLPAARRAKANAANKSWPTKLRTDEISSQQQPWGFPTRAQQHCTLINRAEYACRLLSDPHRTGFRWH